jgi:squalene synthase HpnC
MSDNAASLASGKSHRDENFPVASFLIAPRHRPAVLAFYRFARVADDVADHAEAKPEEKLHLLENMWRTLHGEGDLSPEAAELRRVLDRQGLPIQHALHLLEAFRRDVTKLRYANWDELIDYCRYSAMPVGRFVLDVHGESRETWPASDALCAALQVINHLQDCAKDYRALNRVYLPLDALAKEGVEIEALTAERATPALRRVIASLAERSQALLADAKPFADQIFDARLALEVGVIQKLAESLARKLTRRDPLSDRVHHRSHEALGLALASALSFAVTRPRSRSIRMQHSAHPQRSHR